MSFDISKVRSSTLSPGLAKLGDEVTTSKTFSGTIGVKSSLSTTLDLSFPRNDVITLVKINVSGGNVGSLWFPLTGFIGVYDFGGAYYILVTQTATLSGRTLNFEFINTTAGATVTLPTLTLTAVAQAYAYPW